MDTLALSLPKPTRELLVAKPPKKFWVTKPRKELLGCSCVSHRHIYRCFWVVTTSSRHMRDWKLNAKSTKNSKEGFVIKERGSPLNEIGDAPSLSDIVVAQDTEELVGVGSGGGGGVAFLVKKLYRKVLKILSSLSLAIGELFVIAGVLAIEANLLPIEAEALCPFISYTQKLQISSDEKFSKAVLQATQDNGWYHLGKRWLNKWDIQEIECRNLGKGIRRLVNKKVIDKIWSNIEGKKKIYLEEVRGGIDNNPQYLKAAIPFKLRTQISKLRLSSHHLRVETGRWQHIPRMDRTCQLCGTDAIEDERHVFLQCDATRLLRQKWGISAVHLLELFEILPIVLGKYVSEVFDLHRLYYTVP